MKMRNVKKIAVVMLMITLIAVTAACQSKNTDNGLIGKWFFPHIGVQPFTLIITITENQLTMQDLEGTTEGGDARFDNRSIFLSMAILKKNFVIMKCKTIMYLY